MKLLITMFSLLPFYFPESEAKVVKLTVDNFENVTTDKNLFIKFYDPKSFACREMAGAWSRLAEDFVGHEHTVIAEVDCTSDHGETICDEFEIHQDFPTLLYGDILSHEFYEGENDYESLSSFAKDTLEKPLCSVYRVEYCSEEEKQTIKDLMDKSEEELEAQLGNVERLAKIAEEQFEKDIAEVTKQYEIIASNFHKKLHRIKRDNNFHYIEQIMMLYENEDIEEEEL